MMQAPVYCSYVPGPALMKFSVSLLPICTRNVCPERSLLYAVYSMMIPLGAVGGSHDTCTTAAPKARSCGTP